jgi:hypothetical protein
MIHPEIQQALINRYEIHERNWLEFYGPDPLHTIVSMHPSTHRLIKRRPWIKTHQIVLNHQQRRIYCPSNLVEKLRAALAYETLGLSVPELASPPAAEPGVEG